MKNFKLSLICLLTLAASIFTVNAQTDYTYTLIDNGGYSFTIAAVPTQTTSNFQTAVQGYGFTLFVPDGIGVSITSSLGSNATPNQFNGDQVGGSASEDGYLITESLPTPVDIAAPNNGVDNPVPMVTIQVAGSPTTGELRLLALNEPEASALSGALAPFLTADTEDDGVSVYNNRIINSPTGLSGTSTIQFSSLSTNDITFNDIKVFPNPTKGIVNITGLNNEIVKASVLNVSGQTVITKTNDLNNVDFSSLSTGIYFLNLETETSNKMIKIIRE